MTGPSFAFSIPIGAWHPLLPAALRSLALQEVELHVAVMDASGDSRVRRALDTCGLDFAYRREGADQGQAAAIAEGWRAVDGDILGWLNADDVLMPGALASVRSRFLTDPEVEAVYGNSAIIDAGGTVRGLHGQLADVSEALLRSNCISQPSCFVRRHAVERVGGLNEELVYTMDWDLWVRLFLNGARFVRTPEVFSAVFWGAGTKTAQFSARRVWELTRLSLKYAGARSAARTLLGLATEASGERSALRALAQRSARARGAQAGAVGGVFLAADKHPFENGAPSFDLPILNVTRDAQSAAEIAFDTPNGRVRAEPPAQVHRIGPSTWRVDFGAEIGFGAAGLLRLSAEGGPVRLEHAKWC